MAVNGVNNGQSLPAAPKLQMRSLFEQSWRTILSGKTISSPDRFFQDLFCLRVNQPLIDELLSKETEIRLLGLLRTNIGLTFQQAVHIIQSNDADDVRRDHAVQSLIPFMRQLLAKKYPNGIDLVSMLAGSLSRSDAVLASFVAGLDNVLQDTSAPVALRHQTLQLALAVTCSVGQGSMVAYFLRRDLFTTLTKFISEEATSEFASEAVLLLGLLANYHKYEGRNFYLIRLEDLVDEDLMTRIVKTTTQAMSRCQKAYIDVVDDSPPSFVATLTSLFASFRITEYIGLSAPPSPDPKAKSTAKGAANGEILIENEFSYLPPPDIAALFLPFYDLLNVNKFFGSLLLDSPCADFPPTFLSLASYALCHASVSSRSRAYSRLILIVLTLLVEDGGVASLAADDSAVDVRLCRQRLPMLPIPDASRPLLCPLLDCVLIYLRHSLTKKLHVEAYLAAVKLVHKVMHGLKTARIRLAYDWTNIWRALITLGGLLVSRFIELQSSPQLGELIDSLLITLDFACVWSGHFLSMSDDSILLYYEILRADQVLNKLGDLAGASPSTKQAPRGLGPSGRAKDSVRNLRAVVAHFTARLEEKQESSKSGRVLEADEVIGVVRLHIDSLDLVESNALEDIRPYTEADHQTFFRTLLNHATADVMAVSELAPR